jgi:anti-sigma factor RsiW
MNHQPFEDWLLSDEPLPPEQARALQDHLQDCETCPPLSEAWQAVRIELETAPQAAPAPGFSQRWQAHLEEKRLQERRRRIWLAGGAGLVGLVCLVLLAGPLLESFSPTEILVRLVYGLSLLVVKASQVGVFLGSTFSGVLVVIPITFWVLIATSISALGLFWAFTMWKIIIPKGVRVS